jgi:hypothetical protein
MANLLKQISIISMFLAMGFSAHCQKFEHHLSFPILTLQTTNVPEFKFDVSTSYVNDFYLPNFKYSLDWNKFNIGIEHYYFYKYIGYKDEIGGQITGLNLRSYSILLGREISTKKINFTFGLGMSFLQNYISNYVDVFPQWFEDRPCYEFSKYRFLSYLSLEKTIYKNITVGLNIRYSPMFKPFSDKDFGYYTCTAPHNHDRINFANLQFFIGYRFGKGKQPDASKVLNEGQPYRD